MLLENVERGVELLRELETHLVAVEFSVRNGCMPYASSTCARQILDDALDAFGLGRGEGVPAIDEVA